MAVTDFINCELLAAAVEQEAVDALRSELNELESEQEPLVLQIARVRDSAIALDICCSIRRGDWQEVRDRFVSLNGFSQSAVRYAIARAAGHEFLDNLFHSLDSKAA